jgi:hypothetical protein
MFLHKVFELEKHRDIRTYPQEMIFYRGASRAQSISLWLSRMTSSNLSCNSCCNSLLAWITKHFNSPDVWFLVATSLATEKILVATQLATQLHESRCKSNGLKFYWALSYFSVYWEIAKAFLPCMDSSFSLKWGLSSVFKKKHDWNFMKLFGENLETPKKWLKMHGWKHQNRVHYLQCEWNLAVLVAILWLQYWSPRGRPSLQEEWCRSKNLQKKARGFWISY